MLLSDVASGRFLGGADKAHREIMHELVSRPLYFDLNSKPTDANMRIVDALKKKYYPFTRFAIKKL